MKQTTLRLPDNLYEKVKKEADVRGLTFNGYVIQILWGSFEFKGN